MSRKYFFLYFFISLNFLCAQNNDLYFKYLTKGDGLSNNSIGEIIQDKFGQIWIGTSNGLNKYNGKDFKVYRTEFKNKSSLSNNGILSVLEDSDGYIWVGTFTGLNRYDPKKDSFKRFYRNRANKTSLSNNLVISSLDLGNGSIWFGTGNGVSIYSKKKKEFFRFYQSKNGKSPNSINDIYLDKDKNIWLSTNSKLVKIERDFNNKFKTKEFYFESNQNKFYVNNVLEVKPGVLGVATKYDGYLLFDVQTEKFNRPSNIEIPKNIDVKDLQKDDSDNLWIGTTDGVFVITPDEKTIVIKENRESNSAISQNFIKTIFKDKRGTLWLGTESKGICTWDKSHQNFLHFYNNEINNNTANSIAADENDNIYFGTEGGSVNIKDSHGCISELFRIQNSAKTISYSVKALLYEKPSLLWVANSKNGVLVYDLKNNRIQKGKISEELRAYLNNVVVFDLKNDKKGNIWIGTFTKGLIKYNPDRKEMTVFSRPLLTTNIIKTIHIVEDGTVLSGGVGGVNILKPNLDETYSCSNFLDESKFIRYQVKTIYQDSKKNIWVGTATKGLYKFNGTKFNKVYVDVKNRVSTVNKILEGEKGVLWLSTDKGIVQYNANRRTSVIYEQKRLIHHNDFRDNCGVRNKDDFYFGDLNGVTTFNSKNITKDKRVPKVLISDLKLKNESIHVNDKIGVLKNTLNFTNEIVLSHDKANFSIRYSLPSYVNSEANKYAYRLTGLDDDWTFTKKSEAYFTLQKSGTYVFEVKGANYSSIWNNEPTSLQIIVLPAPWKTWWAYTIYFIFITGLFFGISSILQSKSRLKQKLAFEFEEKRRNEELNQAKLQFFTNISHEFRTPLTLILGPLQNILNEYTGSNVVYKKLKIIEGSANHLLRLINRLMDFRKLESNQLQLEAAEGNIVDFLHEIYLSFSEHAKNGKYKYEFDSSDEEILVFYDRYKLERVFYNLIANAFKYTQEGGCIEVKIQKLEGSLLVEVKDSGTGIPEKYLDKIFDRFFEIPFKTQGEEYRKGTGIGLSIANNIVKLHHGEIKAANNKTEGAVFSVQLKLGKDHLLDSEIIKNYKISDDVSQYVSQLNIEDVSIQKNPEELISEEKKNTILIVEDNVVLRSFIKEILKPDYNVIQAENGKVALEKAIKYVPDLIVSDVLMPVMVGTELCSKIKTTLATSHIPVILLTSRSSLVYKFEGLESGADDYISKPFDIKEFLLRIHNILESKQRLKDKFTSSDNFTLLDAPLMTLDEQLMNKAVKIVKENISNQDFKIAQFCEDLGVSRSMLFTKIKAWANATPNEFIQEIRLSHAAKLLEFHKLNISEVSYEVGFKRPKYFSQCFQKKYGLTPSEYSKKFTRTD